MISLYLASTSPRRRELLRQIGVQFEALATDVDETPLPQELPADYVQRLALLKAQAGLDSLVSKNNAVVLGGDTAVVCGGQIFGKPSDRANALSMLSALAGNTHQVYSAVSLVSKDRQSVRLSVTDVTFRDISVCELDAYWQSGEPKGKAGAYAIQGLGAVFVTRLQGSYTGVVGLPVAETAELLECFDIPVWTGSEY